MVHRQTSTHLPLMGHRRATRLRQAWPMTDMLTSHRGPRVEISAAKLRALRTNAGFTQLELANLAKLTPAQVSRLENGWHNPNRRTVEQLANALGCQFSDLAGVIPHYRPEFRRTRGGELAR